ncbi:MAG: hypothetical protein ACM33V_14645 [Chloroflexota bacterium]
MKKPIIAILLLALSVIACSGLAQSTQAPVSTEPLAPVTPPPAEVQDALSALEPEGEPASDWQGIPVMPGAIAGEEVEDGYSFTTRSTAQDVQQYYEVELGKLGWELFGQTEGKNSSQMLIFTNGDAETLSVSILVKSDELLVLLVK